MKRILTSIAIVASLVFAGSAAAGGKSSASCSVSGSTVTATGLPGGDIYLRSTYDYGRLWQPVGRADNGVLVVTVENPASVYEFISPPHGGGAKWGDNVKVFATC